MRARRNLTTAGSAILLLSVLLTSPAARGAVSGATRVASGLSSPIFVTHAPGDSSRLFMVERGSGTSNSATANIKILNLNTGTVNPTPFLSIPGVNINGEGGLLGMAFSPNYQTDHKFFVFYTAGASGSSFSSYVRQYSAPTNPDVANATGTDVISWSNPQSNHKGGWIGFSPNNNYLYIASGDGGGGYDGADGSGGHTMPDGNAQDITNNFLGKMLRIDPFNDDFPVAVDPSGTKNYAIPPANPMKAGVGPAADDVGDDEIWAYGLRNPFRNSFDRQTGDLWIGDVGQGTKEEIDHEFANSAGGLNFGWRAREGTAQTPNGGGPDLASYADPAYDFGRPGSDPTNDPNNLYKGTVVSGGYVYRGPDPSLQGKYFFLDSRNSVDTTDDNYWRGNASPISNPLTSVTNINSQLAFDTGNHQFPVSFGEDAVGNLYIAYIVSGEVYRLATGELLPGDYNADGDVNNLDYDVWRTTFGTATGNRPADGNGNGVVDAADYVIWRKNFGASVHPGAGSGAAFAAAVPELSTAAYVLEVAIAMLLLPWCQRRPRLVTITA